MGKLIALIVLAVFCFFLLYSLTDKNLVLGRWKSLDSNIEMIFNPNDTYTIIIKGSEKLGHFDLKRNILGVRSIDLKGSIDAENNFPEVISNDYQLIIKSLEFDSLKVVFGQSQITKPWSRPLILIRS